MRSILFILAGLVLLSICYFTGRAIGTGASTHARTGITLFVAFWLIASGVNMWVGVAQAGYSVAEELPIFLMIFGLPAAAGALLWWKAT
jgi:hypothetical protein